MKKVNLLILILTVNFFYSSVYFESGDYLNYKEFYDGLLNNGLSFERFLSFRQTELFFYIIFWFFSFVFGDFGFNLISFITIYLIFDFHYKELSLKKSYLFIWFFFSCFFINYFLTFHLQRQFISLAFYILSFRFHNKFLKLFYITLSLFTHNITFIVIFLYWFNKFRLNFILKVILMLFCFLFFYKIINGNLKEIFHYGGEDRLSLLAISFCIFIILFISELRAIFLLLLFISWLDSYMGLRLWYSLLFLCLPIWVKNIQKTALALLNHILTNSYKLLNY